MLSASTGTWSQLVNSDPAGTGTMMLLSDGRVMVQGGGVTNAWEALKPDATGSYVNGTFSPLASMHLQRLYFASNVLPTGNVLVVGGEYSGPSGNANWTRTAEWYNPVTNKWVNKANFPQTNFGDDPSMVLPNHKVLLGYLSGPQTYLYDTTTNTYTQTGSKLRNDRSDEETWVKLPDGSVLSYDIFASIANGVGSAQRYVPSSGTWVDAGTVPGTLTSTGVGYEMGPAMLLPDGRVLQIGALPASAIYTPSTNSWVAGPDIPGGYGADDAPSAILPGGHVIFAADQPLFNAPTALFDFDPASNSITQVSGLPAGLAVELASAPCFVTRMLVLPTGQLLLNSGGNDLWVYTPDEAANPAWQPTVSSVVYKGNYVFQLKGLRLNGISEGASYGDDAEMSENYPIVRLTDGSGNVFYARSYGWNNVGVQTGNTVVTTKFKLPAGMPAGTYSLQVIAAGIASNPVTVTISSGQVPPGGAVAQDVAALGQTPSRTAATPAPVVHFADARTIVSLLEVSQATDARPGTTAGTSEIGHLTASHLAAERLALDALFASALDTSV